MKSNLLRNVMVLAFIFTGQSAFADVSVGDKPVLEFKDAATGAPISLAKYKGKILIVDFWATWCGPCMAEADHMVAINGEYAPKGLQFIGISLDNDKKEMLQVANQKGFTWPQMCDGLAWGTAPAKAWGVNGIPSTFIIGPEGDVLWKGHPANIAGALADAFKNHPPQLVDPKVLAEAQGIADKVDAALKEGSGAAAVKLLAAFPAAARADAALAARMTEIEKQVVAYADKSLEEVEPLITDKHYVDAATRLTDLSRALATLPAGAKAKKRLAELMAMPEAKAQFELAQKSKAADEELAIAQKLADAKKDEAAYIRFKSIIANFPTTPAAATAKTAVAQYEKNPAFVKQANETAVSAKAKAALGLADSYKKAGRKDLAIAKYQDVIKAYPNTSFAEQAAQAVKELDQ